jgi:cbb3-type cytochrome oxidase subunit 1
MAVQTFDVTARKAHQWTMVALVAVGLVLGGVPGAVLLAAAGAIMLVGRYWWPADVVRQLVWRQLEPRGILKRVERVEDHHTRRVARVIGGAVWIISAVLLIVQATAAAWVLAIAIAVMVALDAALDFCALCFLLLQYQRAR